MPPVEMDKKLISAIKTAKGGRPMQFAFAPKGQDGKLLIDKKVSTKQAAETKTEAGATVVYRGRCVFEEGGLVFELAKDPPATLANLIKKQIKLDAGLTLAVDVRKADSAEDEPPDESPEEQALTARLQTLRPKVAAAAGSPAAAQLQTLLRTAEGMLDNGDVKSATAVVAELETALKSVAPAGGGTAAPAPGGGTATPTADPAAEWKTKLAEMQPAIKKAITDKVPAAADIQRALTQAVAASKPGGNLVAAIASLTEAHALATGAGKPPTGDTPPATPDTGVPKAPDAEADWKAKMAEWKPAIQKAMAEKGPKAADITKLLTDASGLAKPGGDYVAAVSKLKAAHDLAAAAAPVSTKGPPPDIAVTWKAKLAEWGPAIQKAIADGGAKAADIKKLLVDASGLAKPGGNYMDALTKLRRANELAAGPATGPADPLVAEWKEKLAAWGPTIKTAVGAKGPTAADIQKLLVEASGLAKPGYDYAAGLAKLKQAHDLAVAAGGTPESKAKDGPGTTAPGPKGEDEEKEKEEGETEAPGTTAPGPKAKGESDGKAEKVLYTQSRLAWDGTRKTVEAELKTLEQAIRADADRLASDPEADEEYDMASVETGVGELKKVLLKLDERLMDKLDEALNAADPDVRLAKQAEAKTIVGEYLKFVEADPVLTVIDDNEYTATKIRSSVMATLQDLDAKL